MFIGEEETKAELDPNTITTFVSPKVECLGQLLDTSPKVECYEQLLDASPKIYLNPRGN